MLKIQVKRFDKDLPMPEYKTSGAVGLDLYARKTMTVYPGKVEYIPLKVAVKIPKGYFVLIASRGSTHKLGITLANSVGVGDYDYCGNDDEYFYAALNFTKKKVVIERGMRIAQMLILPVEKVRMQEVEKLTARNRGAFGTTGVR